MSTELENVDALREFEVFKERLIEAIGTGEVYGWATSHGFNKGTLYNIMSRQRIPGLDILKRISKETGRSIDWLLGLTNDSIALTSMLVSPSFMQHTESDWSDFLQVPMYTVKASAGHGAYIDHEKVDKYLSFRRDFIRNALQITHNSLYCVEIDGVSMEPALRNGHPALIDPQAVDVLREGPYLLRLEGALLLKNLQRLPGGRLRIWSENQTTNAYQPIEVDWPPREGIDLQVLGRVRWSDRIF